MKKYLLTLLYCLLSVAFLYANNEDGKGIITGGVTTSDGQPATFVTVALNGTNRSTMTNEHGRFILRNVDEGSHKLEISLTGYEIITKEVTVENAKTTNITIVLTISNKQLQEVIVSTRKSNKTNTIVAKMPLKNLENPQVYNTVSSEIMKQQGITSYDDAMRNVPGITRTWESTGRAGDGASYFALRGFDAQPSLINGLPGLTSGNMDPSDVEEIEVIKGPSGTLFGGSFYSYGGIINTITKKPYYNWGGEVAYNVGSFGLQRATADVNIPLSKKEKIALRVNTAYHSEKSFQDAGFKKSFFIAPSLAYEVNSRLSFNVLAEVLNEKRAVPPIFFQSDRENVLDFKTVEELRLNNKLSFTSNELTIKNPRFNLQAQMSYKLSDQWTSQTVFSKGKVKSNGIYTYIWDDEAGDEWFQHYFHNEDQVTNTTDIQQNFNGDFKIGKLRNRLLVGLDYFHRNVVDNGGGWASARNVTPWGDVQYDDPSNPVYLTKASIDNLLASTDPSHSNISNSSYSAYVSDVLNITPSLMAMVSLRGDYFDSKGEKDADDDSYSQFALSPKFGLVYQPIIDKVSVFANYMNAFINVSPQPVVDEDGNYLYTQSFKPEHANQWEFGVKTNLLSDKLNATVSVYDIKVGDRVYPDPANVSNSLQGGKVESKGIELDLNANPVNGLNLIAGYSYNQIKIIEGNETDFYSEPGRSPGGQGPQNLANFWATYKFTTGKIKNFGLGLGGNYGSRYKVIDNRVTGIFYLPSYALLNGSIFYNANHFRVSLNVNNITSEVYYTGYWSINPQKPRNFNASIAYKF